MRFKFFIFTILFFSLPLKIWADEFVPDFNSMQIVQCDISETLSINNSPVAKYNYHRLYRLDDPYNKIYLNKEPIDYITFYDNDKIEFNLQSMTDESITNAHSVINRQSWEYSSTGEVFYDNPDFEPKQVSAIGICKPVN
jgi:hypothetical protein